MLIIFSLIVCTVTFAEFEMNSGPYFNVDSIGVNAIGVDFQFGYIGEKELKGSVLLDIGIGYSFLYIFDVYIGGLAELYYKKIGLGLGYGYNIGMEETYLRAELPILFTNVKLTVLYELTNESKNTFGFRISFREHWLTIWGRFLRGIGRASRSLNESLRSN
jgi:hypothetical protein